MNFLTAMGLDWPHLCPVNHWTVDGGYVHEVNRQYVIDNTTQERYLDETASTTRGKFASITFGGTFYHIVALVVATVYRFFRVLFFYALWKETREKNCGFFSRAFEWIVDASRLLISPLGLPCLLVTALFGLVIGNQDSRKLHAQMEIIFYGHPLLALCMHAQPFKPSYDNSMRRCHVLIVNSIVISPLKMIARVVYHVVRFFTFYPLWKEYGWEAGSWSNRCIAWLREGKNIFTTPFGVFPVFGCALYSLFDVHKAEEWYKNTEITFYGEGLAEILGSNELREHYFGGIQW